MSRAAQITINARCLVAQCQRRRFTRAFFHLQGIVRAVFNVAAK